MNGEDEKVVELIELTKIYRDFWGRQRVRALDGLNLELHKGEVLGLLGPNGSGKTTAVRLILGLLFPTRGFVRLFGKSPRQVNIKKRVGYMPEESNLYEYLNAEEILDFFGRLFKLDRKTRRLRTDALIDMVGLQRSRHRALREYSKGMARRIGFAQALINDPDLLILDEPTTGLDPLGTREIKDLIVTLKNRGKTVLLCSHLLSDVEEICDRICVLYGGKLRALGSVQSLLTEEEFTEIRTPKLPEEVVAEVEGVIRSHLSDDTAIHVGSPTRRLEDYFLTVVDEARKEKLATSGAEAGTGAADFLKGPEEEGEKLVAELVSAGRGEDQTEPEQSQVRTEPVVALQPQQDRVVIDELIAGTEASVPDQSGAVAPTEADLPHGTVRRDVLEDLQQNRADTQADASEDDEPS